MAVGFSWAHLLGDAVSASNFNNLWGHILSRKEAPKSLKLRSHHNKLQSPPKAPSDSPFPLSVKQVNPVGDLWITPNGLRMTTFFIQLPSSKLYSLQSKLPSSTSSFEAISAILWQSIAKIRPGKEPNVVTVCRNSSFNRNGILSNEGRLNSVVADSPPAKAQLLELARLIKKEGPDEMKTLQEIVDRDAESLDLVVYGAKLTFVDMESIDFYGMEIKGQKPLLAECSIDGVGGEGAVLVLPGPDGRLVSVILPEDEIPQLRDLLENEWDIA